MSDLPQLRVTYQAERDVPEREDWLPEAQAAAVYVDALEAEVERLRALLRVAVDTIEDLAMQQEMEDPWYQSPLSEIRAALAGEGDEHAQG